MMIACTCPKPVSTFAATTMAVRNSQLFISTSLCAAASQFWLTGLGVTSARDMRPLTAMTSRAPMPEMMMTARCGMVMQSVW